MNKVLYLLQIFLILNIMLLGQNVSITKVEPPNWWINHPYQNLQLMIYGNGLNNCNVESLNNEIEIKKISHQNNNYIFLEVNLIENLEAKDYLFTINNSNFNYVDTFVFPLYQRDNSPNIHQGFDNSDVIYLVFPDRFVNGNPKNDFIFNDKEEFEFASLNGRYGGDIQGIMSKLDYLKDLGITTIWSTPMLENNMYMSYHGYAATDLYRIDPRFGSNDLYFEFVQQAHEKNFKVIMDHVSNHIGINHYWVNNPPTETWFNGNVENHFSTNHNKIAFLDPYSDEFTQIQNEQGWFTNYMPDLNQNDSLLAKYLIQNTIWWIEYSGIDGIREDTYPYNNQKFMSNWAKTILSIYPNFNIVGEVWKGESTFLAKYQTNSLFPREFDSHLPVVTDFALRDMLVGYLSGKNNLYDIYQLFAQDYLYSNPNNLLVFLDNHDVDRAMYNAKGDLSKFKIALTIILTTRGIPQIFYGTEIGMKGGGHHGLIREPFPGGFFTDKRNAFEEFGRDSLENNIFNFLKTLIKLRNDFYALSEGEFKHFPPENNLYIFKKKLKDQEILIALNDDSVERGVLLNKYLQKGNTSSAKVTNLISGEVLFTNFESRIKVDKNSINIFLFN